MLPLLMRILFEIFFVGNDPRDGEEFLVPVYDIYVEGTGDNAGRWIIFKIRATDFDARTRKPEN